MSASATSINTINHHDNLMPQLEPVDLSRAATTSQTELETFLQRVREGRTELTIQAVETREVREVREVRGQQTERERLEMMRDWSKAKKVHKCNYSGCDKVGCDDDNRRP